MKMVRDRADAYWLPDRFRYALFRLVAYAVYRSSAKTERRGVAFGVDRDQSVIESYAISIWMTIAMTVFTYGFLAKALLRPVAAIAAPFATTLFLQALICWPAAAPRRWRWNNHIDLNSFMVVFLGTLAAAYFAADRTWVAVIAWIFLGTVALNAVAALLVAALRSRFTACTKELLS